MGLTDSNGGLSAADVAAVMNGNGNGFGGFGGDGATIPSSTMEVTPAAVNEYFNVSRAINAQIWAGCCETITVRNTSEQPIQVSGANIIFDRPDLNVTR